MSDYKIKNLPKEEKPREKLINSGPESLKNYELLAIILGKGNKKENVFEISKRVIEEYGSGTAASETGVKKITGLFSIGTVQSCQIVACFELGRRFFGKSRKEIYIRSPKDAYEYLADMGKLTKEHFRGLYLDVKNKLLHNENIFIGTLSSTLIHPREIFQPAIKHSAAGIILAHNHPSGDPEPSEDDIKITRKILDASKVLEINILDHIIIGDAEFISLKEKGII